MHWEDIEKCCTEEAASARAQQQQRSREVRPHLYSMGTVPHDEETLASLLNVHMVGGSTDLSLHLEGATLRPAVVEEPIRLLRASGYPGYEEDGLNSERQVRYRMDRMCRRRYNADKFIPAEIEKAIAAAWEERRGKASFIYDTNATPAERAASVEELNATLRPLEFVAERTSRSMSEAHNEYGSVFQMFQTLDVQTGSAILPQFRPQYIGMAYPFTWPAAVGSVDIPGQYRWRRPTWEESQEGHAQTFPRETSEY